MNIVIATSRTWHEWIADELKKNSNYNVTLITRKEDLTKDQLEKIKPDFVFFPHWSYLVKDEIFNNFNCVIFHMTDLPFGRGGSPLQNLIAREIYHTTLTALKCVSELDAGPIYLKKHLRLNGSASEIFERASRLTFEMINEMLASPIVPYEQEGKATYFSRRLPSESNLYGLTDISRIYDLIRMLDADGYPHAFIENDLIRYEFNDARLIDDEIVATVKIRRKINV